MPPRIATEESCAADELHASYFRLTPLAIYETDPQLHSLDIELLDQFGTRSLQVGNGIMLAVPSLSLTVSNP